MDVQHFLANLPERALKPAPAPMTVANAHPAAADAASVEATAMLALSAVRPSQEVGMRACARGLNRPPKKGPLNSTKKGVGDMCVFQQL